MTITQLATKPRQLVDAPERSPYQYGLLSVLTFGSNDRAGVPLAWDSMGCLVPEAVQDVCIHGADPHEKNSTIECGAQYSTGFTVVAYDTSSLQRGGVSAARAVGQLAYAEQVLVESYALQLLGEHLGTPETVVTGDVLRGALGSVEQALAERGGSGLIIMSRLTATRLADVLSVSGGHLSTILGTPVAAVAGSFSDPMDATSIYGVTGLVGVRGGVTSQANAAGSINDLSAFAERDYSIGFECDVIVAPIA